MEDLKEVLKCIGQTYELFDMMPTKGYTLAERKRKMEAYKKKAMEINTETPKNIKRKANFVMVITPLIAEAIVHYMLRIEFSIWLFFIYYLISFFSVHFVCSIFWSIAEMFKENGLKKGLVKLFWGIVACSILALGFVLLAKFDVVSKHKFQR